MLEDSTQLNSTFFQNSGAEAIRAHSFARAKVTELPPVLVGGGGEAAQLLEGNFGGRVQEEREWGSREWGLIGGRREKQLVMRDLVGERKGGLLGVGGSHKVLGSRCSGDEIPLSIC